MTTHASMGELASPPDVTSAPSIAGAPASRRNDQGCAWIAGTSPAMTIFFLWSKREWLATALSPAEFEAFERAFGPPLLEHFHERDRACAVRSVARRASRRLTLVVVVAGRAFLE